MSSNSYSKSCTPNLGGVKDFYTREEIINLLKLKADKNQVYTKTQVDDLVNGLITGAGFASAEQGALADTAVQPEDLGSAAFTESTDYATAAQGELAGTAVQPGDLGSAAFTESTDYATAAQGELAGTAVQPGDLGSAAFTESTDYATAAQGELAGTAVQPSDLGSAAFTESNDYATAAQGELADTAVQPSDLVTERGSFLETTSTLADQASGYMEIEAFSSYALIEMLISHPCRVRVYSDSASRSADLARPILSGPIAYDSGLIAEVVSETNNYRQIFTPTVTGSNLDSPFSKTVYLTVTNLSGSSQEISITLTLLRLERNPVL